MKEQEEQHRRKLQCAEKYIIAYFICKWHQRTILCFDLLLLASGGENGADCSGVQESSVLVTLNSLASLTQPDFSLAASGLRFSSFWKVQGTKCSLIRQEETISVFQTEI